MISHDIVYYGRYCSLLFPWQLLHCCCQFKHMILSLTTSDLICALVNYARRGRVGLLGLQYLPLTESSQITCCYSHVAEKIQEALPHRKKVTEMNQTDNYCSTGLSKESWSSHFTSFINPPISMFISFHSTHHLTHPCCLSTL